MPERTKITETELLFLLNQKKSIRKISRETGLSRHLIYKAIDELGLTIPQKFNHDFFEVIDTEDKAYWLGYIMADGHVYPPQDAVEITSIDVEHLLKWHKAIGSFHNIHMMRGCGRSSHPSKKMISDLAKHGVVPRKSLVLRFPDTIQSCLMRHLIRGYFDGDGCITYNRNIPSMGFVGTKHFMEGVKDFFQVENRIAKRRNIYDLCWSGYWKCKRLGNILYGNASIFLERKYRRWWDFFHRKYNVSHADFSLNGFDFLETGCKRVGFNIFFDRRFVGRVSGYKYAMSVVDGEGGLTLVRNIKGVQGFHVEELIPCLKAAGDSLLCYVKYSKDIVNQELENKWLLEGTKESLKLPRAMPKDCEKVTRFEKCRSKDGYYS